MANTELKPGWLDRDVQRAAKQAAKMRADELRQQARRAEEDGSELHRKAQRLEREAARDRSTSMTGTAMPDASPVAIAARLSKAQKRALLAMKPHMNWQIKPLGARWAMPFRALLETDMFGRGRADRWKLTPLGQAVRSILAQEAARDE